MVGKWSRVRRSQLSRSLASLAMGFFPGCRSRGREREREAVFQFILARKLQNHVIGHMVLF